METKKITKTIGKNSEVTSEFSIARYKKKITSLINKELKAPTKEEILSDILLDLYISSHKEEIKKSLYLKQIQMKIGKIWQIVIGEYKGFINLKQGHSTGLDVINENKKLIFELKNRYNTDNNSARTSNLNKLAKYKKEHDDYKCIYGIINEKITKPNGCMHIINHDGVELYYYSGRCLLELIFEKDTNDIINTIKHIISLTLN
jgi:hypothetical protein